MPDDRAFSEKNPLRLPIVGTAKLAHLRRNITAGSRGPPETGVLEGIDRAWRHVASDWGSVYLAGQSSLAGAPIKLNYSPV